MTRLRSARRSPSDMPPERPTKAMARSRTAAVIGVGWLCSSAASSHSRPSTRRPRISHQSPSESASCSAPAASCSSSHASAARKLSGSRSSRRRRVSLRIARRRSASSTYQRACRSSMRAGLAGLGEPLARVLPDHREQAIARLALDLLADDERFVDEADERRRRRRPPPHTPSTAARSKVPAKTASRRSSVLSSRSSSR